MKKSVSIVIAIMLTLAAIFTVSVAAFAAEIAPAKEETPKSAETPAIPVPTTTAAPVTAAPTTADARANFAKDYASKVAEESSSKKAAEDASKAVEELSKQVAALTTKSATTLPNSTVEDNAEIVTAAPGQTAIYDEPETAAAAKTPAKGGAKKAAAVNTRVPNTGSSAVVPAFAVLALLAGTVAVVKTKKSEV